MVRAGITAAGLTAAAAALADEKGLDGLTVAALARHFSLRVRLRALIWLHTREPPTSHQRGVPADLSPPSPFVLRLCTVDGWR